MTIPNIATFDHGTCGESHITSRLDSQSQSVRMEPGPNDSWTVNLRLERNKTENIQRQVTAGNVDAKMVCCTCFVPSMGRTISGSS